MKLQYASREEAIEMFNEMAQQADAIEQDIFKLCWYMRGSISLEQAYNLANSDREKIKRVIEDNIELSKQVGTPVL